jgi:CheY-like chemotaxis protein
MSLQLTILVVDDDLRVASAIRRMLARDIVMIANSARTALEACRVTKFDLILCELLLPRVSGPGLCAALEERGVGMHDRVVFMTGSPDATNQLGKHRSAVLAKPFNCGMLEKALLPYRATTAMGAQHPAKARAATSTCSMSCAR